MACYPACDVFVFALLIFLVTIEKLAEWTFHVGVVSERCYADEILAELTQWSVDVMIMSSKAAAGSSPSA